MAKKDDSYWAVRDLVEDQTQEGFMKTNKSMANDLSMLAEEYPEGMADLQKQNTYRQEQFLNRMQFDNEDIIERSPETIRELDEYLVNEAPYNVNVALGSEAKYSIADTNALGYIRPKLPLGTEQRGRMAGAWEDNDPSYTALHETGHAKGLMGDGYFDTVTDRLQYLFDPDEAYEAATTGLDLYRGISSGHEKSTKHALEYLMKQGVDIRDSESLEDLKANIVDGVERLYEKSDGKLQFSDEKREALRSDLDDKFTAIPDLISKFEEEANAPKKMDKLTKHHLENLANGWAVEAENGEGTHTIYTSSVERDGKEYVFPTIWEGKILSVDEAFDRAMEEGVYEEFNSPEEATAFDRMIHEQNPVLGGAMEVIPAEAAQSILDGYNTTQGFSEGGLMQDQSMTDPEYFDVDEYQSDMTAEDYIKAVFDIGTDFTPIIGELKSAKSGIEAYNEGDNFGALMGGLGAIPLAGGVVRGAAKYGDDIVDAIAKVADEFAETGAKVAKAAPKKTEKAYKLFRTKPGSDELYPLFVNADKGVEQGKWIDADVGPLTDQGKVKSKIGNLAYRPGWHSGDYIAATHIGGKATKGAKKPEYRPANQVWAEVEVPADVDWQSVADSRASIVKSGPNKGKLNAKEAHITDQVPEGGHYRYKTNPNMQGNWIISGSMKVNKKMNPEEMAKVQSDTGIYDLPTLPDFIDQKGLSLGDLNKEAVKELKTNYPEKFAEMSKGVEGFNEGGLMKKDKELVDEEYLDSQITPEMKERFEEKVTTDMNFLEKVIYDLTGVVGPDKIKQYIESNSDEVPELAHGGMMMPMGMDIVVGFDEVSGNPIPPGSTAENVRDDIPAMLSDGEYVLPADVVKWHGLSQIMAWQDEAKMGLMSMHCEGLIPEIEEEDLEEVEETEEETSDEDKSEDTPEVEEAVVEVEDELTGEETTEEPEEKKLPGKVKRSKYV